MKNDVINTVNAYIASGASEIAKMRFINRYIDRHRKYEIAENQLRYAEGMIDGLYQVNYLSSDTFADLNGKIRKLRYQAMDLLYTEVGGLN